MATLSGDANAEKKAEKKTRSAQDGAADNDEFHSDKPVASGAGASMTDKVTAENQLTEAGGNRTYADPAPDPGPVLHEGRAHRRNPDRSKGEVTYRDANEPMKTVMRTSTRDSDDSFEEVELAPDLIGNAGASDVYNKEQGDGLTDMAQKNANKGRRIAPTNE